MIIKVWNYCQCYKRFWPNRRFFVYIYICTCTYMNLWIESTVVIHVVQIWTFFLLICFKTNNMIIVNTSNEFDCMFFSYSLAFLFICQYHEHMTYHFMHYWHGLHLFLDHLIIWRSQAVAFKSPTIINKSLFPLIHLHQMHLLLFSICLTQFTQHDPISKSLNWWNSCERI